MIRWPAFLAILPLALCAEPGSPMLAHNPAVNGTTIVFAYAGDLWSVPRAGGEAQRLTNGAGIEDNPIFSPDGTRIAFRGEYDGNIDVFVVDAGGGVPKRLTYHPGPDSPVSWTPDSQRVVFQSARSSYSRFTRLFTVGLDAALPAPIELPIAYEGVFSPDGRRIAYVPEAPAFQAWKRYRGGRTSRIWIASVADLAIDKVPRDNSNDYNPMWSGNKLYFLSDRNGGRFTLHSYDPANRKVTQVVPNRGYDIKSASAWQDAIAYEQFGSIHLYDLKSGRSAPVPIRLAGDLPGVRPSLEKVAKSIQNAGISPTGVRAVFEARGEILTVPAEKGSVRNLTNTPDAAERDPAWSPDGQRIAYYSDESGEYALHIRDQNGMGDVRKINLGNPPGFYYTPKWSPDSKKVAYTNQRLEVAYLDLDAKTPVRIDADTYHTPDRSLNPSWSPDSKWIVYTKILPNHLRAVFLYSLESGQAAQISDGMSDAQYAAFDKNGKYLYFLASTNTGLSTAWLDMSSLERPVVRSVYAAVLSKEDPSPVAPQSDEEKPGAQAEDTEKGKDKEKDAANKDVTGRIDLAGIGQRIVALPVPPRNYVSLEAGKTGILFLGESIELPGEEPAVTVHKFDLEKRKTESFVEGVKGFVLSANGEKILFQKGENWVIAGTGSVPKSGEGTLKTADMEVHVDPRAEWAQMYREVWRMERDFFYDPGLHGLNLQATRKQYEPFLASVAHREDLNYLFSEMLGELSVGHLFVRGGAMPDVRKVPGGLLGADYEIENGRYRFAKIFSGENWNPKLEAPLTRPGVNAAPGEYLLAVNGRPLQASDNVYQFFEGTAGKSVVIRVGPNPSDDGSREVTVVPIKSESELRNRDWIESNRRKVDQLSNGRVAYVYLPDTTSAGYESFNRYYFAQLGRDGAVIDERFNSGGQVAEYVVDYLRRPLLSYFSTRYGADFTVPQNAIFGPKAMIVNEYAGSGGDALPWMFKKMGIGPLIGRRTWGGLVGIFGFPLLIDGGRVTAPNLAFWNPFTGEWDVENHGVEVDREVEFEPAAARAGRDPQLEAAVAYIMDELNKNPPRKYEKPRYPNYHGTSNGAGAR